MQRSGVTRSLHAVWLSDSALRGRNPDRSPECAADALVRKRVATTNDRAASVQRRKLPGNGVAGVLHPSGREDRLQPVPSKTADSILFNGPQVPIGSGLNHSVGGKLRICLTA